VTHDREPETTCVQRVGGVGRGFALVLAVSTLGAMGSGAVAPVLPLFIRDDLGGGDTLVGIVVGIAPLCSLVGGLLAGSRADRYGRRIVAIGGLSVALAGALLLVPAEGVTLTALARTIYGFGVGAAAAATITWAVDEVPAERRGRALSVYGMTVWVGLSVGPQLGQAVANATDFQGVWVMVAMIELIALVLVLVGREPPHAPSPAEAGPGSRRLVPRGAARPGILIATAAYGEGVITALLVLHLVDHGVHAGAGFGGAASVFTVFAASVIVFRIIAAPVMDRVRPEQIATTGFVLEALGLAVLAVSSSFVLAGVGAALMGAGFAVMFPSLALVAARASSPAERGAALGSFGASFGFGLFLGSILGGTISSLGGTSAALLSGTVLATTAAAYLAGRRLEGTAVEPVFERAP
jgi:MFS family permease